MAILKLALLGAPGSGKTQLAQELAANALLPPLRVDDHTSLQTLVASQIGESGPFAARAELLTLARIHLEKYDLTLLMGLDLLPCDTRQAEELTDSLLRRCLAETSIAYQVIYGHGADRQHQAIQAISRLSKPVVSLDASGAETAPKVDAGAPSPVLFRSGATKSAWVWMCDKCSDAQCEHLTLLAQKAGKLLKG